jgi:hypothetical protein
LYEYRNTVQQEATPIKSARVRTRCAWLWIDTNYIPEKLATSAELKEVERAIWRCTGLKL